MTDDEAGRLYLDLKGVRQILCRAQAQLDESDRHTLQGALDRVDLVMACNLPPHPVPPPT